MTATAPSQDRQLGPIIGATLVCADIDSVSHAYQHVMGFRLVRSTTVNQQLATLWQAQSLIGHRLHILASSDHTPWLRLVEDPNTTPPTPLKQYGWMSLETNVGCVDSLRTRFEQCAMNNQPFSVIGEPAYLQVSDAIKAMQVIGPAGEVSYLTQVDRDVPPFELPQTEDETSGLFIPVLSTPDRMKSLAFYQQLNNADKGLCFDTKVTVLNNAWGFDIEHQFPVATLQLNGRCLFEIDQVDNATPVTQKQGTLPSGIALITCQVKCIERICHTLELPISDIITLTDDYYSPEKGQQARVLCVTGPAGEMIEFVQS